MPVLESLDERIVPTALTWTDLTQNGSFYTAANWYYTGTETVASAAPVGATT